MSCGIYKITSPSNRVYVGQSTNIENRFVQYIGFNCKQQRRLYSSLKKYGWYYHTFEILTLCKECDLNDLEAHYINFYSAHNRLNIVVPTIVGVKDKLRLDMETRQRNWEEKLALREITLRERQQKKIIRERKREEKNKIIEERKRIAESFNIFMTELVQKFKMKISNMESVEEQRINSTPEKSKEFKEWALNEFKDWERINAVNGKHLFC